MNRIKNDEKLLFSDLKEFDPEIAEIMDKELERQRQCLNLIASENFTSRSVYDALGSIMSNKYSEGYPGSRYYAGNEFIDQVERICQNRALEAFRLDPRQWGVNVQSLSGSPANLQVYQALLRPHERIMGLDLPHGGHLSHGYQTDTKKISAVSTYFETMPYRCDIETGLIDYDMLEKTVQLYRPKIIVAGTSAYCRVFDYERFRKIADSVKAYLMVDMAHISGLVAAGVISSPFDYADIVTTTTHKSLRGPRGAMIFFRKGIRSEGPKDPVYYDLEERINFSVFPGHQGGPHNHTIAALSVALKQVMTPEFKEYQIMVKQNAKTMETRFKELDYDLVTGGTDLHMVLINLKPKGIDGARGERVLELCNIICNKNTTPKDKSAISPCGLRFGSPAMTTRGFKKEDFERVVSYIDRAIKVGAEIQKALPKEANKLADFKAALSNEKMTRQNDDKIQPMRNEILKIKEEVKQWCDGYDVPN